MDKDKLSTDIIITDQFPGGNITVDRIEGNDIDISQDLRDTKPWWHYWNFKIVVNRPQKLFFHFKDEIIGYFGPAINEGNGWHYDKTTFIDHRNFNYDFLHSGTYQFAFSIPYQVEDFERFFEIISPQSKKHFAVKTNSGRDQFYITAGNQKSDSFILFTCRHHACESMAEFVLEGILMELILTSNPVIRDCAIYCFPFIDLDGVENGDQGKDRQPHDHNRDYIDEPIYPITKFLMKFIKSKPLLYSFDLHCPAKYYDIHDYMSLIQLEAPYNKEQERFSRCLEKQNHQDKCSIEYLQEHNIVHGKDWNIGKSKGCSRFCNESGAKLALTFETPYFGHRNKPYMPQELREFGKSFGKAIIQYHADSNIKKFEN